VEDLFDQREKSVFKRARLWRASSVVKDGITREMKNVWVRNAGSWPDICETKG